MSREPKAPIWARPEPRGRGQRAPLSRKQIVTVALRIADEEGLEAVSMRRIAKELSAGAMSLYHYFDSRDELFELMGDTVAREMLVPELPAHWACVPATRNPTTGPTGPTRHSAAAGSSSTPASPASTPTSPTANISSTTTTKTGTASATSSTTTSRTTTNDTPSKPPDTRTSSRTTPTRTGSATRSPSSGTTPTWRPPDDKLPHV